MLLKNNSILSCSSHLDEQTTFVEADAPDCSSQGLMAIFMGLGALLLKQGPASSICRSYGVQLNWLIPLSVTECDWQSDASARWGV